MPADERAVAVERRGAAAWIALHDGARDAQLALALKDALREDATRCLVLAASGLGLHAPAALLQLRTATLPTIAALRGSVTGNGAALLLACDLRVLGAETTVTVSPLDPETPLAAGVSWELGRTLGRSRAFELLYSGRTLGAEAALELGLVSHVVPEAELDAAVDALVSQLAARPRAALSAIKRALNRAEQVDFDESLEFDDLLEST